MARGRRRRKLWARFAFLGGGIHQVGGISGVYGRTDEGGTSIGLGNRRGSIIDSLRRHRVLQERFLETLRERTHAHGLIIVGTVRPTTSSGEHFASLAHEFHPGPATHHPEATQGASLCAQ